MEFSLVQTLTNEDLAASEAKIWASLHPEQGHTFLDSDIKTEQAIDNGDASASSYHENLSHEAKQQEILRHRGSSWFDEPDIPEETEHSELSSQPSFASLEVPENARILEPLLRDYVDVPVVCVAEAKVMPSVMSKLLYQRNIWGLSEPVLGFIISDDGLVVRLAIGWTEIHEGKVGFFLLLTDDLADGTPEQCSYGHFFCEFRRRGPRSISSSQPSRVHVLRTIYFGARSDHTRTFRHSFPSSS